jgi:hypothetical protein
MAGALQERHCPIPTPCNLLPPSLYRNLPKPRKAGKLERAAIQPRHAGCRTMVRRWLLAPILAQILRLELRLMSASDDLVANVASLKTAVSAELQAISDKLAAALPDDPNVVQANTDIQALITSLNAETATLSPTPAA